MALVVEHLPGKYKALNLIPNTTHTKKRLHTIGVLWHTPVIPVDRRLKQ
jgi:PhoPQ-activated pathogenicity-related protein